MWKRMNRYTKKRLIGDIALMVVGLMLSIYVAARIVSFITADVKYRGTAVITDVDKQASFKNNSKYYMYQLTYTFTAEGKEYTYRSKEESEVNNAYRVGEEETIYIYSTDDGKNFSHLPSMTIIIFIQALGILMVVVGILDFKKEWGIAKQRWGDIHDQ